MVAATSLQSLGWVYGSIQDDGAGFGEFGELGRIGDYPAFVGGVAEGLDSPGFDLSYDAVDGVAVKDLDYELAGAGFGGRVGLVFGFERADPFHAVEFAQGGDGPTRDFDQEREVRDVFEDLGAGSREGELVGVGYGPFEGNEIVTRADGLGLDGCRGNRASAAGVDVPGPEVNSARPRGCERE